MAEGSHREVGVQLSLFGGDARPNPQELLSRYQDLNCRYFAGRLPQPKFRFSPRMLHAGMVTLETAEIVFSIPYHDKHGWGNELTSTLKHEMIHLWLHVRGRPSGHTKEFMRECERIGAPRYCRPLSRPYKYLYRCSRGHEVRTRKRIPGHSCARCAPSYHPNYRLRLVRRLDGKK